VTDWGPTGTSDGPDSSTTCTAIEAAKLEPEGAPSPTRRRRPGAAPTRLVMTERTPASPSDSEWRPVFLNSDELSSRVSSVLSPVLSVEQSSVTMRHWWAWTICLSAVGSTRICSDRNPDVCQTLGTSACQDPWFARNCCGTCAMHSAPRSATLCDKDIDISVTIANAYFLIPVRTVRHAEELAAAWCGEHPELERRNCLEEASSAIGEVCSLVFDALDSPSEALMTPPCGRSVARYPRVLPEPRFGDCSRGRWKLSRAACRILRCSHCTRLTFHRRGGGARPPQQLPSTSALHAHPRSAQHNATHPPTRSCRRRRRHGRYACPYGRPTVTHVPSTTRANPSTAQPEVSSRGRVAHGPARRCRLRAGATTTCRLFDASRCKCARSAVNMLSPGTTTSTLSHSRSAEAARCTDLRR
jgi:hypothetical protein